MWEKTQISTFNASTKDGIKIMEALSQCSFVIQSLVNGCHCHDISEFFTCI